jgi:IS5 family transposase
MLLLERAIDQAVQRILNGTAVPARAKVISPFEAHTQILQRGKAPPHETEFGHKVNCEMSTH